MKLGGFWSKTWIFYPPAPNNIHVTEICEKQNIPLEDSIQTPT